MKGFEMGIWDSFGEFSFRLIFYKFSSTASIGLCIVAWRGRAPLFFIFILSVTENFVKRRIQREIKKQKGTRVLWLLWVLLLLKSFFVCFGKKNTYHGYSQKKMLTYRLQRMLLWFSLYVSLQDMCKFASLHRGGESAVDPMLVCKTCLVQTGWLFDIWGWEQQPSWTSYALGVEDFLINRVKSYGPWFHGLWHDLHGKKETKESLMKRGEKRR